MTKNKSVQDKIDELKTLVGWFDSDEFVLEQAAERFKQAEMLAADIKKDLAGLKNDIEVIKKRFDEET